MKPVRHCDQCQAELPGDAPEGLCPQCLLQLGGMELGISLTLQSERRGKQNAETESPATMSGEPARENQRNEIPAATGVGGTRFGDYEILEKIGRGGMGAVYMARQINLDRVVALKLLPLGAWSGPNLVERFRSEAKAAAALQHPNIVAVHDVGEQDGQPYFSMDFVEGRTLAELVRDQPLPAKPAATYLKTIAAAVHYAHQQGVLHRDLKPSNILIDAADQPRITDFGLAKRLGGDSDMTLTGQVLGSPNFMPPEQAEGRSEWVSPASDVYSLGAVLYNLLTRQPPFQADTVTTLLKQVVEAEPVPPCSLNPNIPRDLETVCLKCLEKDPARRYPTAQALADDLGRFLRGEPILARPVSAGVKAWKWCRRRPALAGLGAALVLTFLSGLTAVLWQLRQTRAESLTAQQNAYAADMNLARAAIESDDLGGAISLLAAHDPGPGRRDFRGWEWRYLWSLCRSDELFTLTRSEVAKERVAFTPDGRWLSVVDAQADIVFWDVNSRQSVFSFHTGGYRRPCVLAAQTNLLAYGVASEEAVSIVSLDNGREVARLLNTSNIAHLAFSGDATRLFILSQDGVFTSWDISSAQPIRRAVFPLPDLIPRLPLTFSPSGELVGFGVRSDPSAFGPAHKLCLWEVNSGRHIQLRLTGTRNAVTSLRFSPDNRWLAGGVGETESEVHVWRVEDLWHATGAAPAPFAKFGQHRDWICDLAFSPDGGAVVSASADSTLRVWEFDHPEVCHRYQGHEHQVLSVAWSPDGKRIASAGRDGSVRVWATQIAPPARGPRVLPIPPARWSFRLSPDARRALTLDPTNGMPVLWDIDNAQILEKLDFAGTNLSRLAWSHDGRRMAASDEVGNIRVWDLAPRRLVASLAIPGYSIRNPRLSRDGRFLACGGIRPGGGVSKLWSVEDGREIPLPAKATENVAGVDFSPDYRRFAALHDRGTLELWDIPSGRCLLTLPQPYAAPWNDGSVVWAPDGRTLATCTMNGVLALWDTEAGAPPVVVARSTQELLNLAFSPDGSRLLVGGKRAADVLRLLDVSSKRFVANLPGPPDYYRAVCMSADNSTVYAIGEENILLWRAPSWEEIQAAEKGRQGP